MLMSDRRDRGKQVSEKSNSTKTIYQNEQHIISKVYGWKN